MLDRLSAASKHCRGLGHRHLEEIDQSQASQKPERQDSFPAGLHNAFLFAGINALSYQMVLNSPMILYAK